MREASGRILALATPLCFTRSPRTRPGPAGQMRSRASGGALLTSAQLSTYYVGYHEDSTDLTTKIE
jgi:hypothetical protein